MKKYILAIAVAVAGFIALTAFSNSDELTAEQKEQLTQIETMVSEKLEMFKMEKDSICRAKAYEVAVVRADSIMAAAKVKPVYRKKKTTKPVVTKPTTSNPKKDKMSGASKEISTQAKKDKMKGEEAVKKASTDKKKSKMSGKK